jgi:pimeloyl-ACP methyl ester carboxylesterase
VGAFGYVEALNRILASLRLEEAARATRTPVLLVYGAADRLVPPEQGERLAELLPRAKLMILPGETHLTTPLAPAAVEAVVGRIAGGSAGARD